MASEAHPPEYMWRVWSEEGEIVIEFHRISDDSWQHVRMSRKDALGFADHLRTATLDWDK